MLNEQVRSARMEWSIRDTFYSDYFHTAHGQLEYWLLWMFLQSMEGRWHKFPMFWYGAANSLSLYLEHAAYSPFLYNPRYPEKMALKWDMRNVPEGQEDTIDKDYLPVGHR